MPPIPPVVAAKIREELTPTHGSVPHASPILPPLAHPPAAASTCIGGVRIGSAPGGGAFAPIAEETPSSPYLEG